MPEMTSDAIKDLIRDVPDFPKPGILFKDITTLLQDTQAFQAVIDDMAVRFADQSIDVIVAVEARGFIFGSALAYKLDAGLIPIRKKGKLPAATRSVTYDLEYGTDELHVHEDAIKADQRVLIVDDVLATGGTIEAVHRLVTELGANVVSTVFLMELTFLNGRQRLGDVPIYTMLQY